MGASASIIPNSCERWHPDNLTARLLREEFPEFAGALRGLQMGSLNSKISFKHDSGKVITENLENGGSETGAQIRKAKLKWMGQRKKNQPGTAIVKLTDVTEVPQMKLLMTRSWLKRQIVKLLLNGEGGKYLWDLIPRFILAECSVRRAMEKIPRLEVLLTPLYFSRVRVSQFPTQSTWAMKGISSIPSSWTVQGMAEIKPPLVSASGPTGHSPTSGVTEVIAGAILEGLARFHGACWGMGRSSPLTKWILDIDPSASTLTLYYPTKFGLCPYHNELPDTNAPMAPGGDGRFTKLNIAKFVSKLGLGLKEICEPYVDVMKKLQKMYPRIRKEICYVTDGRNRGNEKSPSRYGYFQTILHGDAHAWNIFWNLEAQKHERIKFIDLTNVGQGRCAWEVYYFIVQSFHCTDWLQLHRILAQYYHALVMSCSPCARARDGAKFNQKPTEGTLSYTHIASTRSDRVQLLSTMPYGSFLREFYLLALVHTVHIFAEMNRAGKYVGKSAVKLAKMEQEEGKKGSRVRKDVMYSKIFAKRSLWLAKEILARAGEVISMDLHD
eukprot:g592.t1